MKIKVEQAPTREWFAIDEDNYDGAPDAPHMMGWGNTAAEAVEDLQRLCQERDEAWADRHEAEAQRRSNCPYTEAEIERMQRLTAQLFGFKEEEQDI